ncbi:conserved Plasmodium protein, unknown function [Plasmodium knowlesi strain H]|uniref:Transmembrane protein n=2 Tax=Plasmodium knowlesi TaxID=5850 RepID=B3L2X3_PLAKH|nr:conserved Plasmodium protein, unknown function [Plasmodium knowlesi strain H]OTN67341.1 Uncharacterized protein PKNOH_S06430500 [Plasmodium knowlesi]CAA9987575.1 conserved Plasmodium protein, unknown function [Plasmodium knowlesi strain H]VVS77049.1 conserved Plasmodium protein, unknown function [Plasmodium knowlesi strain H]|eukprot:XP_002258577.1 hypothetical protein, conserved in Plasmodium species [Plasmodium knowlesi strain H]
MALFTRLTFFFFLFVSSPHLCYSFKNNRGREQTLQSCDPTHVQSLDKKFLESQLWKKNRLYYVSSSKNLFRRSFQMNHAPRVKMALSLFKDMNMSNLFPGFKTIFNKKFLFEPLFNSHKDIIMRNMKKIQLIQKGNVVKNLVIFGASCFTIYAVSKLLLMLRRFFQNQYKMISEQEIKMLGKYENPHIEFKD